MPDRDDAGYDSPQTASWDEQFADDAEVGLEDDDPEIVAEEHANDSTPLAPPALPDLRKGVT
jgi:hypothetical protein